jgi:putative flippase GtrA
MTSVVEFVTFGLGAYVLFMHLHQESFEWGIITYPIESGGLGTFLAFATSYIIAQVFNFIVQRKSTFKATNHIIWSAIMYALMVLGIYLLQLLLPPLLLPAMIGVLGYEWGALLVKSLMMTMATVIQYPLNKWVIMKNTTYRGEKKEEHPL